MWRKLAVLAFVAAAAACAAAAECGPFVRVTPDATINHPDCLDPQQLANIQPSGTRSVRVVLNQRTLIEGGSHLCQVPVENAQRIETVRGGDPVRLGCGYVPATATRLCSTRTSWTIRTQAYVD